MACGFAVFRSVRSVGILAFVSALVFALVLVLVLCLVCVLLLLFVHGAYSFLRVVIVFHRKEVLCKKSSSARYGGFFVNSRRKPKRSTAKVLLFGSGG